MVQYMKHKNLDNQNQTNRNRESNILEDRTYSKVGYRLLYRVLTLLAVVAWMAVIFFFSAQTGEESNQVASDFWIRKAAHMCEYAILTGLVWLHLQSYKQLRGDRKSVV